MTYKKINFNSKDGLEMTADLYEVNKPKDFILLCHRSHCNRAEYRETAPRLNELGFSCLAIDQRSGMKVFGETNETKDRAKAKGLPTGYLDARQDLEAAIDYVYELNEKNKIILFGSSYSAALALLVSTQTHKVKVTIAYSPGEYLKGVNLSNEIKRIDKPTYVTSPKAEIKQVTDLTKNVIPKFLTHFIPTVDGFHGSKTLWKEVSGHETYWTSLENFLNRIT